MKERRIYGAELNAEAIKMTADQGLAWGEISRRLSIPKGTVVNWLVGNENRITNGVPETNPLPN